MTNVIKNLEEALEKDGVYPFKIFVKKGGERPLPIS